MIRRNPAQTWPQTRAFLSLTGSHFTEIGARYDGKIVISSFCAVLATNIWSDLRKSGFITNNEKSQWCPSQVLEWLGIIWNTINGTISISERRVNSIAKSVNKILLRDRLVSARELASLVGRIISGGAVFGNLSRLMTRYCSISVASAQEWDSKFYLDQY